MHELTYKQILVIGLGSSGLAACELLRTRGARVTAVDSADTGNLRREGERLGRLNIVVRLGVETLPDQPFDLAILSPGVPCQSRLVRQVQERRVPLIGELELGYQHSLCLNVAITGTNGKTTTTELVERMLTRHHLKTIAAGNIGLPLCRVVRQTRELDFITLEVSSFQLETTQFFRPAIGVLLNLTPDHLDRYPNMAAYV